MAYPYSLIKTVVTGGPITAIDRNNEHQNHINNKIPASIDDLSSDVSAMQATRDPYPSGTASLAVTQAEEAQSLRYLIDQITGEAQWYVDPDTDIATLAATRVDVNNALAALNDSDTPAGTAATVKARVDQIVSQMKRITGESAWTTAPDIAVTTLYAAGSGRDVYKTTGNVLVNGGMEIWQRGTSFATPSDQAYLADKWQVDYLGTVSGHTATVSRQTGADEGNYNLRLAWTVAGNVTGINVFQSVENFQEYISKTVSLSARCKTSTASQLRVAIDDGVSVTYSSYHTGGGDYETLTVTHAVSASATKLHVYAVSVTATGTYDTDCLYLTISSTPIAYSPEDPAIAMERCQRYYELGGSSTNPFKHGARGWTWQVGPGVHTKSIITRQQFKVEKSGTPTVTITSVKIAEDGSNTDVKASYSSTGTATTQGFVIESSTVGTSASQYAAYHEFYWVASV